MFKNLINKYKQLSQNKQIIIAFMINGFIIEILKFILLIQLKDPVAAVTYGTTASYIIAYIIQYKVYKIGSFFSNILVKYIGFTLIAILSIRILVNYLLNLPSVQRYLAEEESESNKKTVQYLLMVSPVILFTLIQLLVNRKYIFIVSEKDNQYILILYSIAFTIYYLNSFDIFTPPKVDLEENKTTTEIINNNNNNQKNSKNNVNNDINNDVNDDVNKNKMNKTNNIITSISIDTSKVRL